MADDAGGQNVLAHPLCVIIPEGIPIERKHKTDRVNIVVTKNVPILHRPTASRLTRDADLSYIKCRKKSVKMVVPEDHPGFKEGRCYHVVCEICGKRNLTLEQVGYHMEVTKFVLCCPYEEKVKVVHISPRRFLRRR